MRRILLSIGLITGLAGSATVAALPFEITFDGTVESLTTLGTPGAPNLETRFAVGDAMSGRTIVDNDDATLSTVSLFEITVDGYMATTSVGSAELRNDYQAGSAAPFVDSILISGPNASGAAINGVAVDALQFALGTENLSVLDAASVIDAATILALWNDTPNYFSGNLNWMFFDDNEGVRFSLQNVSVRSFAAPEPVTVGLLGIGLLVALRFGRGRQAGA